jgi:hypothetical protein
MLLIEIMFADIDRYFHVLSVSVIRNKSEGQVLARIAYTSQIFFSFGAKAVLSN